MAANVFVSDYLDDPEQVELRARFARLRRIVTLGDAYEAFVDEGEPTLTLPEVPTPSVIGGMSY